MEYFPATLTPRETDAFVDRIEAEFSLRGYGLWAVEIPDLSGFIGFVGLHAVEAGQGFEFAPAVEVGWRLAAEFWGHGYASEAAAAAIRFGFEHGGLEEIVSFTSVVNERSQAVMRRVGMLRDPAEDFDHPRVAVGDRLRRHRLYRLPKAAWSRKTPP